MSIVQKDTNPIQTGLDVLSQFFVAVGRIQSEIGEVTRDFGLTYDQFFILRGLHQSGPMHAGKLRKDYFAGTNITYNLNKLETMGYVDRQISKMDRRVSMVCLTDTGAGVVERCSEKLSDMKITQALPLSIDGKDIAHLQLR